MLRLFYLVQIWQNQKGNQNKIKLRKLNWNEGNLSVIKIGIKNFQ